MVLSADCRRFVFSLALMWEVISLVPLCGGHVLILSK